MESEFIPNYKWFYRILWILSLWRNNPRLKKKLKSSENKIGNITRNGITPPSNRHNLKNGQATRPSLMRSNQGMDYTMINNIVQISSFSHSQSIYFCFIISYCVDASLNFTRGALSLDLSDDLKENCRLGAEIVGVHWKMFQSPNPSNNVNGLRVWTEKNTLGSLSSGLH